MRKQKLREVNVTFLNDLICLQVAKIGSKSHLSDSESYILSILHRDPDFTVT